MANTKRRISGENAVSRYLAPYLNRESLLPLVLVLILLLLTWWLLDDTRVKPLEDQSAPTHNSDYYIRGFTTLALDESGQRRYQLVADHLIHFIDTDSTKMTRLRYSRFNGSTGAVLINANTGIGAKDNSLLDLQGEVHIISKDGFDQTLVETKTDQLALYPNRDFAETNSPVTIENADSITKGIGMTLDSRAGKLVLLSKVSSIYYPGGRDSR